MPTVNRPERDVWPDRFRRLEQRVQDLERGQPTSVRVTARSGAYAELAADGDTIHVRVVNSSGGVVFDQTAS